MTDILTIKNYERVRAAYTAMDHSYTKVTSGDVLVAVDNSGHQKKQPFETPAGYKVTANKKA